LYVVETADGLAARIEYSTDLFDAATIRRLLAHYRVLLEGIAADPEQKISALPLLEPAERRQLLVDWNDTRTDYARAQTIPELFEAQVARTPDAVAVVFEDQRFTYRELDLRAGNLAAYLRALGVKPG